MTSRELKQIVEIEIDRCSNVYGSAPCQAVLGTTGVRKCYNTFATCQDASNYRISPEPTLKPADRTYAQGDEIEGTDFSITDAVAFAVDLSIPETSPDGVIWVLGGGSVGSYLGFSLGALIYRAGSGASLSPSDACRIQANPDQLLGKTGTIYGTVDPATQVANLWWKQAGSVDIVNLGEATAAAAFPSGRWSGFTDGWVGTSTGTVPGGENGDTYNGTITALRVYDVESWDDSGARRVMRFGKDNASLNVREKVNPVLKSVSTVPMQINLGDNSSRDSGIGKRGVVTVAVDDFKDSDIWFDLYQSERVDGTAQTDEGGYSPLDRGTALTKLRRRFPYYSGRACRIYEGTSDQSIDEMRVKNYVMTAWSGPNVNGAASFTVKDVLDLADNKKALAPEASKGDLGSDITAANGQTFDLVPEDIGEEYPASGFALIGSEIVGYTRSGDAVTITERAVGGSEASSQSEGASFQECLHFEDAGLADVAYALCVDYAGIDPSFIDLDEWQAETGRWLAGLKLNAYLPQPTGVNKLLGELSKFGVVFWWDDVNQKIDLRCNRPVDLGETLIDLNEQADILDGTASAKDLYEQRVSRVMFWHGVRDYSKSPTEENSDRVNVEVDGEGESSLAYDQKNTMNIVTRWLGNAGNDAVAKPVSRRLLNRFKDTPRQLTIRCDVKNRDELGLALPMLVQTQVLVDDTGKDTDTQMQITSIKDVVAGHTVEVVAQSYEFLNRYGFITENSRGDYTVATDAEKASGTYFVDETTLEFGDGTGPYVFF